MGRVDIVVANASVEIDRPSTSTTAFGRQVVSTAVDVELMQKLLPPMGTQMGPLRPSAISR
jgi:hypothetical protein